MNADDEVWRNFGKCVHTLSRVCFSASLASLWLRRSSRLCCCSLKPFCFCRASVIHKGPVSLSFSWTLELSSECLLWSDGFSAAKHKSTLDKRSRTMLQCHICDIWVRRPLLMSSVFLSTFSLQGMLIEGKKDLFSFGSSSS